MTIFSHRMIITNDKVQAKPADTEAMHNYESIAGRSQSVVLH